MIEQDLSALFEQLSGELQQHQALGDAGAEAAALYSELNGLTTFLTQQSAALRDASQETAPLDL